ncbi:MAG: class I SAM-dependent methyltransferase [Anaerolineaceae bacterium]|nr:MAG: class I SAM-dependent methyltransferase [Anaerolineaceae bacterium]
MSDAHHQDNRQSWNAATRRHNIHKGDQAAFLRDGGNTLFPEEIDLLGDVRGRTLAHLQCNTGVDTLSIAAHLGADVTGIDISDEAVDFAQALSRDSGIPAQFIRADLFDWFDANDQPFDAVFTSYGTTGWLSDLTRWGAGVAGALKDGGRFVMVEFHPVVGMLGDDGRHISFDYMGGGHIYNADGVGDYVGVQGGESTNTGTPTAVAPDDATWHNPHPAHEFAWGLADHLNALIAAGLTITRVEEYPHCNGWKPFDNMIEREGRQMFMPESAFVIPLMFGIHAIKR